MHFMGHGDVHGSLLWVKQGDKKEYEPMDAELVASVLRAQSSEVRACVVNACGTRPLAVALRRAGIGDVVYWDGAVRDDVAREPPPLVTAYCWKAPPEPGPPFDASTLVAMMAESMNTVDRRRV